MAQSGLQARSIHMGAQPAPTITVENREGISDARMRSSWRLLARGSWITLLALTLVNFVASLPPYIAQLRTPCVGGACEYQQLTPGREWAARGAPHDISPLPYGVTVMVPAM